MTPPSDRNWKCTICGDVLAAEAPPAHCPECGARAAMFEPTEEPPHGIPHNPFQPHDVADRRVGDVVGPAESGCVDTD